MGDEHSERMDKIEKKQEEIMGQLSKILELISTDKGKKAVGSSGTPEDVQQIETNTDPVYPLGFTPPPARNASTPMPSVGQYPFFGMPIGPPLTYAQQRPIGGASPSDPISVPDLDDPKEQEKLKFANHLVGPLYIEPIKPPFPRWYDTSAHCDYHYGIEGHSIENCTAFKHKVQGLIKAGILNFEKKSEQNVNNNPLPNHAGAGVNAIEREVYVKRNIREVETSMEKVFEALVKADMLEVWPECPNVNDSRDIQRLCCLYHKGCMGHSIQDCSSFRKEVQRMMDESKIEFYTEASESAVNMISKESTHPMKIKPLTIFYEPKGEFVEDKTHAKIIIEVPKPFPYKDNKAVP
ncbi:Uncharacterized protein TCM_014378 [Theobroma cacao]|uniref:Gag-pro-like protein n=1 Tax=Theobroma cacao TaxID=3641 RepID=A0A061FZ93_THECC|nr:Uncharacterized protein TCM_014378 [Theobroma cacao]